MKRPRPKLVIKVAIWRLNPNFRTKSIANEIASNLEYIGFRATAEVYKPKRRA